MRTILRPLTCATLSTLFVLLLTACGLTISDPGLFAGGASKVSIAITGPSTVTLGAQSQYAATVTGSSDDTVTWSVNGVAGGDATNGSITSKGLYNAPASAPQSSHVTITATSVSAPSVSNSLAVALAAGQKYPTGQSTVTLTLSGATTVALGTSMQYAAVVTGSPDTDVTWSVNGVVGGNATAGSISEEGLYTAPASAPPSAQVTITAASVASPTVSQSLTVALVNPPEPPDGGDGGSPVTLTLSGAASVTLGDSSQYAATVTGSSDTVVAWSVDGVVGGDAIVGSISTEGLYKAPSTAPSSLKVTITATSQADPSVAQSLAVALVAPATGGGTGNDPTVTLALSGATTVTLGSSSQYAATVTGSTNKAVSWSVDGVVGGDDSVGSISANGLYKAPATAPQSSKVTITATSVADSSVAQSLAVTLASPSTPPVITLTLTGATTVTLGNSSQYAATVSGSTNKAVTWSVNGVTGGSAALGSISAAGRYTAPAKTPGSSKVTITATSQADPSVAQSLAITLVAPPPPVITLSLTGATTVTLGTSSQYAATVSGSTNKAVSWSVNGIAGGSATLGSISAAGRYTAPAKAPGSSKVTITATSQADPSVAQSLAVTLLEPSTPPVITLTLTGATTVTLGTSSQYAATVSGSTNRAVSWSVNGIAGGSATLGSISAAGRYTAPAKAPGSSKVTITATSLADPSVAQSLAVSLAAPAPPPITLTLAGATTVTLGNASQYTATVTGSTNKAVTWSVNGIAGGSATLGSISAAGRYTAPAKAPAPSKVTITATSQADPSVAQSLAVALAAPAPPPITLTLTGAATVTLGTSSQYVATVTGSSAGVTWSVNGAAGGNATTGSISAKGLYTAPTDMPNSSTVTITATTVANPLIAKSLVTTLVASGSPSSRIPANAISTGNLESSTKWQWHYDQGTPGSAQGSTVYPVSGLSPDDAAREFYMTYSAKGGELYSLHFGSDTNATHFVYDTYVYVVDPSQLANLEMDINDVMADGKTVILGTQCSGYAKTWEYTAIVNGKSGWHPSNIPCNPATWAAKTWHHIQIASHRDSNGIATYDWVSFDGTYSDFHGAVGLSGRSLGWQKGTLLLNFQIDGSSKGSGSNTLYVDRLTVYRW